MPVAPMLPPEMMAKANAQAPASPANFLMAAASMSKGGEIPDAPHRSIPSSGGARLLQTGKAPGKGKLRMLK